MKKIETESLFDKLSARQYKIGSCESFTGGLFADVITDHQGATNVFKGSIVAYNDDVKINLVKVNKRTIKKYGVVSAQCSQEMAINAQKLLKSHVCVSFTGNADGNVAQNEKPYFGYISVAILKAVHTFEINASTQTKINREIFKEIAVKFAIDKVVELLN